MIVDWETAAIAAPGASLRRFATLDVETQWDAAQHYVAYLGAKGLSAAVDDVLFVMGAVQVLASLHKGGAAMPQSMPEGRSGRA